MNLFQRVSWYLKQIISPPFCVYCKQFLADDVVLCDECRAQIIPVVSHELEITTTKRMRVLAIGRYEEPLRGLILAKSGSRQLISRQLGHLLWSMSHIQNMHFDGVVPIPLHWTRYAWRGYNQAKEMAQVIAYKSGKPLLDVLRRAKRTPYLTYYAADERRCAMADVFSLKTGTDVRGKHLLLIDDVMTSGATLKEAARELWKAKPASITAAVVARVVR